MASTKDLGPFYFHVLIYPIKPKVFIEKAYSQEIEGQYRRGYGVAIRAPFTNKAVVLGVWKKTGYTESQGLTYAINGRGLKNEEMNWDYIRYGADTCSEEETKKIDRNLK